MTPIATDRSISALNAFSKIFEEAIKPLTVHFIEQNHLFSESQHGYCLGRFAESAISNFIFNVYKYLERTLCSTVVGIFIDYYSKALDTVS